MVPAGSVAGLVDGAVVECRGDRGAGGQYQDSKVLSPDMLRGVCRVLVRLVHREKMKRLVFRTSGSRDAESGVCSCLSSAMTDT